MKTIRTYALALFAGSLIFIGLPLLGWGLRDLPRFIANPARTVYLIVILLLQLFAVIYNPQAGRSAEQPQSDAAKSKVDLVLIQVFSLTLVFLAPFSDRRAFLVLGLSDWVRYVGLLLLIPGFLLMQIAEKYLARQFSVSVTLQKDHQLIQNGPYKFIRHPRYLGILTFFLGISLTFQSLLALLVVVALAGVLVWRIQAEEALMQQTFGPEWEAYCHTSWRILPYLY